MDVEVVRKASVDLLQEVEELARPVALVALSDDEAGGDVEGGEQRRGAVANVVVSTSLRHARHHRQDRLLAIERLDFAFFVTHRTSARSGGDR